MRVEWRDDVRRWSHRAARLLPPIGRLAEQRDTLARECDDLRQQLEEREATAVHVEYPIHPAVRDWRGTAGGDALHRLIADGDERYLALLDKAAATAEQLASLTVEATDDPTVPFWNNGWLPPVDGIVLTHLLQEQRPRTYLEIGSGNSTKFARHAIRTAGLDTRIVSIDPQPRAEIDSICDLVVRAGLESPATLEQFRRLEPGDVVFFDGSHYCFQNSDVTAFFLELLAEIPAGCPYGVHDIFLPDDYPAEWLERFYNEQYVLAAWILGGSAGDDVLLPAWYVSSRPQFDPARKALLDASGAGPETHGGAFWMRRA